MQISHFLLVNLQAILRESYFLLLISARIPWTSSSYEDGLLICPLFLHMHDLLDFLDNFKVLINLTLEPICDAKSLERILKLSPDALYNLFIR